MMGWTQALLLLCSTVSAAVVSHIATTTLDRDISSGAGSADDKSYSLQYLVPCDHCSHELENQIIPINLTILDASTECGSTDTLLFNGSPLPFTDWQNTINQQVRTNLTDSASLPVEVEAHFQLGCLNADTSIISFRIISLDSRPAPVRTGFTLSFKQQNHAREIRFHADPLPNIDAVDVDIRWGDPNSRGGLVLEYQTLRDIEIAIDQLREKHSEQQHHIKNIIVNEFKACSGLYCYLEKAKESAPYLSTLLKTLFCQKYNHKQATVSPSQVSFSSTEKSQQPPQHNTLPGLDHAAHEHRPYNSPSSNDRLISASGSDLTEEYIEHQQPGFVSRHRVPILLSVLGSVLSSSLIIVCIKAAKGKFSCCIDPRIRREYATCREERRTRAAYRRAACRQKVKKWWSALRKPTATSDYEEKRSRILAQEGLLDHVMQDEIEQLQRAHEIVSDMIRAEEGRQTRQHDVNLSTQRPPIYIRDHGRGVNNNIRNANGEGSSLRSISTLPLYSSPPPSYNADFRGEMTVVEGFHYTPSNSDNTSESSVIDCNSRISFDTDSIDARD